MFQNLWIALVVLVTSLIILVKGADFFLNSASKIAKHFGISEFIIGLTVVSVGTSLPEFATVISATLADKPGLILGNLIGSNIANIGLVLGLTLMFATVAVRTYEFEKIFIMLISVLLFSLFASDLVITRYESIILVGTFLLYTVSIFRFNIKFKKPKTYREYFSFFFKLRGLIDLQRLREYKESAKDRKSRRPPKRLIKEAFLYEVFRAFALMIVGIILLVIGAKFTVSSAVDLAFFLQVPQSVVAALLIAVGTSLPELFINLTGVARGYTKIVLGNIIGSNIFNIAVILGIAGIIRPVTLNGTTLNFLIPAVLIFSFLLFFFLRRTQKIGRLEGIALYVLYVIFLFLLFVLRG